MLDDARGPPLVDREAIASLLLRVSRIACGGAHIGEIDRNSVIAGRDGQAIADAGVILNGERARLRVDIPISLSRHRAGAASAHA
ncbi:MAG: hypothetical protein H7125_17470 [Proteobacteria bacterium]|nr:hypothetical protein [Burkholderiales bacterium]